jgi:hypothetical protein
MSLRFGTDTGFDRELLAEHGSSGNRFGVTTCDVSIHLTIEPSG